MNVQTVFLDIDGTLYFNERIIESALEAVQQLQANGYTVVLCTGRSVLHAKPIRAKLNVHHGVYFNGGLTQSHDEIIAAYPLRHDVVERMKTYTQDHDLPLILHTTHQALSFQPVPPIYQPILREYDFPSIQQIRTLSEDEPVFQANVMVPESYDEKLQEHFPECLLYRWDRGGIDLQKGGCNKSIGARALLKHFGQTPETALHIGDGGNDIGMFQTVGMSIAMGNATLDVKEQARMVTDRADEDGVFNAFRKLKLI